MGATVWQRSLFGLALLTTVALAFAADSLPFEIQNGRGAGGLTFTVQSQARGPTSWTRSVRISVVGDAARTTKRLVIVNPILLETEGGTSVRVHPAPEPPDQNL